MPVPRPPWLEEPSDPQAEAKADRELGEWLLRERFPRKPGQRHVETHGGRPLGLRYGEDAEPLGEQLGPKLIALLASHVDSEARLASLRRCLESVDAQTERPVRFLVSTSTSPRFAEAAVAIVEGSACVDEHVHQGSVSLPQFEHYRRLRDIVREREEYLEDVWVFFTDDDDLWHPDRCSSFLAAVESVHRQVQRHVQAVCSCVHLRPPNSDLLCRNAAEVTQVLSEMINGSQAFGAEHIDLCVRYSTFSAFFEEHCTRVVRHVLADVRFCYFVKHYGETPHCMAGNEMTSFVNVVDITNPERTTGTIKVFHPVSKSSKCAANWMYFYDKVRDPDMHALGTGTAVRELLPDDKLYFDDLASHVSRTASATGPVLLKTHGEQHAEELLLVSTFRQALDYRLMRLPRQRLVALELEVQSVADQVVASRPGALMMQRFGSVDVARWARAVAAMRCKALKVEVLCAEGFCAVCGRAAHLRCGQCHVELYCCEDCQWDAWHKGHRRLCRGPITPLNSNAGGGPPDSSGSLAVVAGSVGVVAPQLVSRTDLVWEAAD